MFYFVKNNTLHRFPVPMRCGVIRENEPLEDSIPKAVSECIYCMRRWPDERRETSMELGQVKEMAKKHSIKTSKTNKADLIRAIQTAEGNVACFASGRASQCGQNSCLWRGDCV